MHGFHRSSPTRTSFVDLESRSRRVRKVVERPRIDEYAAESRVGESFKGEVPTEQRKGRWSPTTVLECQARQPLYRSGRLRFTPNWKRMNWK